MTRVVMTVVWLQVFSVAVLAQDEVAVPTEEEGAAGEVDQEAQRRLEALTDIIPLDLYTGRTLQARELQISPLGYLHYGIIDSLTLELDYLVIIAGSFLGNIKYRVVEEQEDIPAIAVNLAYLYLNRQIEIGDVQGIRGTKMEVTRDGSSLSLDAAFTKSITESWALSGRLGFTYGEFYQTETDGILKARTDFVAPHVQLGWEFFILENKPWAKRLSWVTHGGYGNSLLFFDQTVYKYSIVSGLVYAPCRFATMEFGVGTFYFPESNDWIIGPVGTVNLGIRF